jgi:hypothetical protein
MCTRVYANICNLKAYFIFDVFVTGHFVVLLKAPFIKGTGILRVYVPIKKIYNNNKLKKYYYYYYYFLFILKIFKKK